MGFSMATFFMAALCRFSIDYYGWRGAMFILAGVTLNGCVMAMLMMPVPAQEKSKPNALSTVFNISILTNINFVLFLFVNVLNHAQVGVLLQLSTSRAVTKGMTKIQASYLPAMIGIASTIARFISSWISNMKCTSHMGMYAGCVFGISLMMIASCFGADDFVYALVCCCVMGSGVGRFNYVINYHLII